MLLFSEKFKKLAEKETRMVTVLRKGDFGSLPLGHYVFVESYCEEKNCDCRRVFISVLGRNVDKILASISMGFDSESYAAGPFLDDLNIQSEYSKDLMGLFLHVINTDRAYLARLQRHYVIFKEKIDGKAYRGEPFETPGSIERIEKSMDMPRLGMSKPTIRSLPKTGRNEPCPCGSGKKYKKCCMNAPLEDGDKTPEARAAQEPQAPRAPREPGETETKATAGDLAEEEALDEVRALVSHVERNLLRKTEKRVTDQHMEKVIKENPLLAFPLLRLLIKDYAPDRTAREVSLSYQACLTLLEYALTEIRFSIERKRQWAVEAAERIQQEMAALAFKVEVNIRVQNDLVQVIYNAKLEPHPDIKTKREELAQYYGRFMTHKGPPDMDSIFDVIVAGGPDNSFSMLEHLTAELDLLPVEGQLGVAVNMAGARNPLVRELAALLLLNQNPEVRAPLPSLFLELIDPGSFSPATLRRMIGIRNWLPRAERPALDALIKKLREAHVECAPMPPVQRVKPYGSSFDGSGVQGLWNIVGKKGGHRFASVLVKQGWGIRDVMGMDQIERREAESMLRELGGKAVVATIQSSYLDLAISHFIHVGQQRGDPPPAGLVYVAEAMGAAYWSPREIVPEEEIDELEKAVAPLFLTPENVAEVLQASRNWPSGEHFGVSWLEDDSKVDDLVESIPLSNSSTFVKNLGKATDLILEKVVKEKYDVWAERLLWMTLWAKACRGPSPLPWVNFFILAREFRKGTSPKKIPLLVGAAERSVFAALQRREVMPR